MTAQALSIHAHFYQPPREDPLTGLIPEETGASPYPNWNARIHAECYRPNAELRNFQQISFNIGPTLASWMQSHDPQIFGEITRQDAINVQRHGIGNAIAQAYNHTILPLNTYQDKVTQVYWGIADFQHRFGRAPQGMWLPETAVDLETLEVLARHNIQFTILAPWQAEPTNIDPTEPYTVTLPHQRQVAVFFYHRDLSGRISFDPQATTNADFFAQHILQNQFNPEKTHRGEAQIILVASDGELYGHHQQLRNLFLARLVDGASSQLGITPTYLAHWLQQHPPRQNVNIRERTSWSCHHGVMRWMGQCGCTNGDAAWKAQLRYALNHLAEDLDRVYLEVTRPLFSDPWMLRNRYIHVMLGEMSFKQLVGEMSSRALTTYQERKVLLLLEAQRQRQRMFTSCGFFFDDFDRIEPRNNVAYAAQAVILTHMGSGVNLENSLLNDLKRVVSPTTQLRADAVFQKHMHRACGYPDQGYTFSASSL